MGDAFALPFEVGLRDGLENMREHVVFFLCVCFFFLCGGFFFVGCFFFFKGNTQIK